MKIALIAPTEIPARRANTIQVMKMAQALSDLGHEVRLAAPALHKLPPPDWDELQRHYGLQRAFPLDWLPARASFRRYDYSLAAVRWARGWEAELIYTRLPQAAALASLLAIPTVFELHDLPAGPWSARLLRLFFTGRGKRRLVLITQALADDLEQRLGAPLTAPFTIIAPDGVDLARYHDLPQPVEARQALAKQLKQPLPERFTAGYTGHLYAGRGAELLLALAAQLPQINFLLVGGEPGDVQRLKAQVQAQGLANVFLTGFVPNADLPQYQAACEALLMPYGGRVAASSGGDIARYLSPMKLFEYLAAGRAILSSDLPVLREALNADNAILLPGDDLAAWAQALTDLQHDPSRRAALAQQAQRDAGRYTWTARAGRIFEGL